MYFTPPITPFDAPEDSALKKLTEEQRFTLSLLQGVIYLVSALVALLICGLLFTSCTTPRAVEEHHHHHYETDTAAVHAQVDRQLASWHEEMTQLFTERLEQFSSEMQQSEHQQETITELITITTDSLGREVRQEQRSISRDITRELQQQEQRLTREYEERLQSVVDSVGDTWQQRYDSLASHLTSDISHQTSSTPVGDTRPWYRRLWDRLHPIVIIALIAAALWYSHSLIIRFRQIIKIHKTD